MALIDASVCGWVLFGRPRPLSPSLCVYPRSSRDCRFARICP